MATRMFGAPVQRNVDDRLLTGRGRYIDDIELPGALHAAFLRSPFARAKILSIDVSAAEALPGVVAVHTAGTIGHLDQPMPLLIPHPCLRSPATTCTMSARPWRWWWRSTAMSPRTRSG